MKTLFSIATAAALALAGAATAAPGTKPQRVMSLNICTDQLILQLLPPERIASIYYLSRSPDYSFLTAEAARVPIHYGNPEEVLRDRPDLVIAGAVSTPALRALLRRVGTPLVEVPAAESFDEIRAVMRQVAHAVGEDEAGEALIARMDLTLAELATTAPARRITVAGWDGAGNIPAKGTLFDAILTAAGFENLAATMNRNIVYGRYIGFDLEQLAAMRPDILAYGQSRTEKLDLAGEQLRHRLVRRLYTGRQVTYSETLYACGLPQSADAARDLRTAVLNAMAKSEPLP